MTPEFEEADRDLRRRSLLACVHIAKKDLGLRDEEYEAVLRGFGVESSAHLPLPELRRLVKYLKFLGWKPRHRPAPEEKVVKALRERVRAEIALVAEGEARLAGVARKVLGVDSWLWINEAAKLMRLLAILRRMRRERELKSCNGTEEQG